MVVVDASLVVKLFVPEQYSDQAKSLASSWEADGTLLVAPDFMASEFATALRKKIQEGGLDALEARNLISVLYDSGIDFRPSRLLHDRAIELAVELNQRLAYDCHYLALAESMNCDFWTADEPFYRAARSSYPHVRWIGNY